MSADSPSIQPAPSQESSPQPVQALQQVVGYLDRHKALGIIAVQQTQHFSWQARFAYLQWTSLSSTFEQILGGSAVTVAFVIFSLSPFPILSVLAVVLLAWQYVLVTYHKEIRRISAEVEQVSYRAKVAVENSRAYATSMSTHEQSILSLVAMLCNDAGRYNLGTVPGVGPLLTANIDAIAPVAKELSALVTTSSTDLPKILQGFEHVRWLADKANLLAKHGEMAAAAALIESMSTELTSILEVEGKLLEAKTKAHEIAVQIHLDDLVDSHKKVLEQLQLSATPPAPEPREPEPPALPNTVTLRNPKAIVGALSGAPEDVDDKAFTLTVPFPITLYGHSSTTLSINDNGMICLDQAPSQTIANVRTGQQLPFRNGLAPYSLFPLWKDLKITKGKPHGIYYDVEGASPNRKLTIEYYVTRYNMEEQYFHFLVVLEEARPNVVTFRYYDVQDRGAEGTVGVQGPDSHSQFSHNEQKISPGLQVVFNTAPEVDDIHTSTFSLP
ncbi:hypothetical protein BDW62DRAFT_219500 [Aspergillus aurantiobrunneus]